MLPTFSCNKSDKLFRLIQTESYYAECINLPKDIMFGTIYPLQKFSFSWAIFCRNWYIAKPGRLEQNKASQKSSIIRTTEDKLSQMNDRTSRMTCYLIQVSALKWFRQAYHRARACNVSSPLAAMLLFPSPKWFYGPEQAGSVKIEAIVFAPIH